MTGQGIAGRARNDMGSMEEDGKNSGVAAVFHPSEFAIRLLLVFAF